MKELKINYQTLYRTVCPIKQKKLKIIENAFKLIFKLQTIANRGVKVYPGGFSDTFTVDHWRCRFVAETGEGSEVSPAQIISLLQRFDNSGLDVIKTENLYNFDGAKGYSG